MTDDVVEIRRIGSAEGEAYLRLRKEGVTAHAWDSDMVSLMLAGARYPDVMLVAALGGEECGVAFMESSAWSAPTYGVAVVESARRRGVGRALADALVGLAPIAEAGASLVVDVSDPRVAAFLRARGLPAPDPEQNDSFRLVLDPASVRRAAALAALPAGYRFASTADVPHDHTLWRALAALEDSRPSDAVGGPVDPDDRRRTALRHLDHGGFSALVLDPDGVPVAEAVTIALPWTTAYASDRTTVLPAHQGRRLSVAVKAHQAVLAHERGGTSIATIVQRSNGRMRRTLATLGYGPGGQDWVLVPPVPSS